MKILLISSAVLPVPVPGYGGLEMIVYSLSIELAALGHKVTVVAPSFSKLPPEIEFVDAGEPGKITEDHLYNKVGERINNLEFDIAHSHDWGKRIYLFKKNKPEIKVITTLHGMCPYEQPPPVKYPNMVGLSKTHALEISGRLGINTRWCWNGTDINFYTFQKEKKDYLLWLGRYMPGKGAHIAIDVARRTNTRLELVGDDTMVESQDYVRRIMQMCADTQGLVRYWGPVPRERAAEFFRNARAFLQTGIPPWSEPFGLVTIEALASGTPVVALRNGATVEILEYHNAKNLDKVGLLCNSPDDMVTAIKSDELSKINPETCRKYAEVFSQRNMALNYLKLYTDVLNGQEW